MSFWKQCQILNLFSRRNQQDLWEKIMSSLLTKEFLMPCDPSKSGISPCNLESYMGSRSSLPGHAVRLSQNPGNFCSYLAFCHLPHILIFLVLLAASLGKYLNICMFTCLPKKSLYNSSALSRSCISFKCRFFILFSLFSLTSVYS